MARETKVLKVEGMTCSHCENRIKKAIEGLAGVRRVDVDLKGGSVIMDFESESLSLDTIREIIEDQGYDVK